MKKNILFCGTPFFAVASLMSLFKHQNELNYLLRGVVTIPDKIAGRGQKARESAIKKEAKRLQLPIFTPKDLSERKFMNEIEKLNLDLIIVVAFKKLPKLLFEKPKIGTINLHASLLPKYKGAAPINWAIINGEKDTGLTTFFINEVIDAGDIILQSSININHEWHANELHDALMNNSDEIIKKTIKTVLSGCYKRQIQTKVINPATEYARKIKKSDLIIDNLFWQKKTLQEIYNFMKGMSPPGIRVRILIQKNNNENMKKNIIITRVGDYKTISPSLNRSKIDSIYIDTAYKNQIIVTNVSESFNIKKLKTENGKELSSQDFYNGFIKNKNTSNQISICK